jgi:uncharacterized protein (TIGR03000 family)
LREQVRKLQGGKPMKPEEASAKTTAHVVVRVPEDARLFVDETPCPLTSTRREFDTPQLTPGQEYFYTLRAEVQREGRTVTRSKRLTVRAGEESTADFGEMRALETAGR